MQYLLTAEEYNNLVKAADSSIKIEKLELQELCSRIAREMPISRSWSDWPPSPWGCILVKESRTEYCDECPVQKICPKIGKEYSK